MEKYLIVGTGGVGGSIAGFLALAGKDVTCIARGKHLEAIREKGLHLRSDLKGNHFLPIQAEGGNLAASKIRNLECPNYEICLIDYGCGKFNRKIHIMEQYP